MSEFDTIINELNKGSSSETSPAKAIAAREELRKRLAALGIDLPASKGDVANIAKRIVELQAQAHEAEIALARGDINKDSFEADPARALQLEKLKGFQGEIAKLGGQFTDYAREAFVEEPKFDRDTLRTQLKGLGIDTLPVTMEDVSLAGRKLAQLVKEGASPAQVDAARTQLSGYAHQVFDKKDEFDTTVTRSMMAQMGVNLPMSMGDVNEAAKNLFELQHDPNADPARVEYAQKLFQQYVSQLDREKRAKDTGRDPRSMPRTDPEVDQAVRNVPALSRSFQKPARVPTSREFESYFDKSYDAQITGMAGLGLAEKEFALRILKPTMMAKYAGSLKEMDNPFNMGDSGGSNVAAVGMGNESQFQRQGAQFAQLASAAGGPGSTVASPNLGAPDYLSSLSESVIKNLYEGHRAGAGQFNRQSQISARRQ